MSNIIELATSYRMHTKALHDRYEPKCDRYGFLITNRAIHLRRKVTNIRPRGSVYWRLYRLEHDKHGPDGVGITRVRRRSDTK